MTARIRPAQIKQIRDMVSLGYRTKEIAFEVGVSESTVHKIRQNRYPRLLRAAEGEEDEHEAQWCPRCRCHVYPPCQSCRLQEFRGRNPSSGPVARRPPGLHIHDPEVAQKLATSISQIGLPVRTVNYLQQREIMTVHDLLVCRAEQLRRIPNFGNKTIEQIYLALERLGFVRASRRRELRKSA